MIDLLRRRMAAVRADLLLKIEVADWHGVADCAMDLREIEAELRGLQHQKQEWLLSLPRPTLTINPFPAPVRQTAEDKSNDAL